MSYTQFPTRFGKYILLDRLNSGGMAEVYRAKVTGAEKFQRLVAIKCMLPSLNEDEQFITMFVDEAKLAAQLSHANIVQIYELGRINEQLYIAMDLIAGRDLRHIIKRILASKLEVPVGFVAYVVSKAAEGLDFAHRKIGVDGRPMNLVHRDVSPQNILVSYDGEVKVVDFGIAKAEVRDTETRAGVLKGKFAYMAPEQVMGGAIDRRADIFALGAVMFETMTGRKLFQGESDFSILEKVREAEIPSVASQLEAVPPEIDEVLRKAMAKTPEERFEWASDFAEALTPMLIQDRSIFGTKQAKEFMQQLYADDIAEGQEALRRYIEISEEDCVENSIQKRQPRSSEVFETTLDEAIDALPSLNPEDDHALSADLRDEDVEMEEDNSGWTQMGTSPAFGEELSNATELLPLDEVQSLAGISKSAPAPQPVPAPRREPSHPSLRPQPYADSPSVSGGSMQSGVSQPGQPAGAGRSIFYGLVTATVLMLVAVVVVAVIMLKDKNKPSVTAMQGDGTTAVAPAQPVEVEPEPAPTTTVVVGSGIENSRPTPTPPPEPEPESKPEPTTVSAGETGADVAAETGEKRKGKRKKGTKGGRIGYVTIQAKGVKAAKVSIDGKELGYAPIVYRKVKTGKHRVRVVEDGGSRTKVLDIQVSASNTRKEPLKLLVTF